MRKTNNQPSQVFYRSASINKIERNRAEGDDDQPDTYTFSLSSTAPVEVWRNEFEVLDHGEKSIRMEFLASGNAPLLWMHDREQPLGIIDSARVEGDKIEVTVRFGESNFAKEKKRDVDAGTLKNVSIGFRIHSWEAAESKDGVDTYRVMDWEPFEGSLVTIPADKSVGMGRSASFRSLLSDDDNTGNQSSQTRKPSKTMPATADPKPPIDLEKERRQAASDAVANDRQRMTAIREIGSKTKIPGVDLSAIVERALSDETSVDSFRGDVLKLIQENAPKLNQIDMGAGKKERQRYSIQKVMLGIRSGNLAKHAPYEAEVSEELKRRMGKEGDTIAIPHDVILRGWIPKNPQALALMASNYGMSERDLSSITLSGTNQDASAANLVETELLDEMFIYSLREHSSILEAGVTMIGGLVGNVEIPVELLNPAFAWVGEDVEPAEGDYTLGKVGLTFRTIAAQIPFTRQAEKQTTPGLENLLTRSLRIGSSLGLASALYNGSGSSGQPTGIMNTTGVGSVDTNGATTRDVLVDHEIALGTANAVGETYTAMNTALAGAFAKTKVDAGSGQFVGKYSRGAHRMLETEIGDIAIDNLVPADTIIHGIPSTLVVGMWGTMELGIDTSTKAATGGKVVRVFLDADCVVPQAATWVVGTDVA